MSNAPQDAPTDQDGNAGQVAETGRLDPAEADTPISDSQSIYGSPSDEPGEVNEGPSGPKSRGGIKRD